MVNPSAAGQAVARLSPGSAAAPLLLPQGPNAGTERMYEDSWVKPGIPVGWSSRWHQAAPDEAQGTALLLLSHCRWPCHRCHLGGLRANGQRGHTPIGTPTGIRGASTHGGRRILEPQQGHPQGQGGGPRVTYGPGAVAAGPLSHRAFTR